MISETWKAHGRNNTMRHPELSDLQGGQTDAVSSALRLADEWEHRSFEIATELRRLDALVKEQAAEIERLKAQRVPLTDAECDAIYQALNAWAREVDAYDFGLPMFAADGHVGGRAVIRNAIEAAHEIHPLQRLADLSKEIGEKL